MARILLAGSIALAVLSAPVAGADEPSKERQLRAGVVPGKTHPQPVQVHVEAIRGPGKTVVVQARPVQVRKPMLGFVSEAIKLGDYWLGVECYPAGGALRAQLGLAKDQGLVVEEVLPDSPAAKAGIKQHDVLVTAGDKPLGGVPELIEVIEATKEKELSIELIRGGNKQTIKATPAKRPQHARQPGPITLPGGDWERVEKWFGRMLPGGSMELRFLHPPAVLPPGAKVSPPLPGNMSISVTKEGDKPAKIVVKKDDRTWELTEDDLDKLPEDVRPHVERMLGRLPGGPIDRIRQFDFIPDELIVPGQAKERIKQRLKAIPEGAARERIENLEELLQKRLEQMDLRLEQLRKAIEELRENRPRLRREPGEEPEEL